MRLVERPDLISADWFATGAGRAQHADTLDGAVGNWIAQRDEREVLRSFAEADAAIAPIYSVADLMEDPQVRAREAIVEVADSDLGPLKMQNVMFRLARTPGEIRWAGRRIGENNEEVYGELGLSATELADLRQHKII